jgi:hypothetical protein
MEEKRFASSSVHQWPLWFVNSNVAKAGGLQSQGAKGAAVASYCKPLATPDLEPSG